MYHYETGFGELVLPEREPSDLIGTQVDANYARFLLNEWGMCFSEASIEVQQVILSAEKQSPEPNHQIFMDNRGNL